MIGDEHLRGRMEVPGAAIVTQAFPQLQNSLLVGRRKGVHGWKGIEKTLEVRNDGRDGRLLEHDFAHPDSIRVAARAPRQIALGRVEPGQESSAKSSKGSLVGELQVKSTRLVNERGPSRNRDEPFLLEA